MRFDLDGDEAIVKELRRAALRTGALGNVLGDIGGMLEASAQQRFLDEKGPDGTAWEKHSDATIESRGSGAAKLRDRQHLFDSLSHQATSKEVAVGVNRVYARIQQLGGEAGRPGARVEIPARPYLGVSSDDEREMLQIVRDHVRGKA